MKLIILTKSPKAHFFSVETVKLFAKRLLGRVRGPGSVIQSFLRGLDELKVEYLLNPNEKLINGADIVWVNESLAALRWAISAKQANKIARLYAGPNMVVAPADAGGIISNPAIDKLIFPSDWTKEFFVSHDSKFIDKIEICPAGVALPEKDMNIERDLVVIYDKHCSNSGLSQSVKDCLTRRQIKFAVVEYGRYNQLEYFELLSRAKAMVYLSDSESQGLALQEAWIRNVPTLVWNRGYIMYNNYKWEDKLISAPYLTPEAGEFFREQDRFDESFAEFWKKLSNFTPADYVRNHLTDVLFARQLLTIMKYYE